MRLRAENALAGDDSRRRKALSDMLEQIARLNTLVTEMLSMTHRREAHPVMVELYPFLADCAGMHHGEAAANNISIETESTVVRAKFDPDIVGLIIGNLLSNAILHTPAGG